MTSNSFWSHVLHVCAGLVIVAVPMLMAQIPLSWQAETVGGVLGLLLGVAKNYFGLTS